MSQTSLVLGALVVAFIVYVTSKGQLPGYLYVLGLSSSVPSGCNASASQAAAAVPTETTTSGGTGSGVSGPAGGSDAPTLGSLPTLTPLSGYTSQTGYM